MRFDDAGFIKQEESKAECVAGPHHLNTVVAAVLMKECNSCFETVVLRQSLVVAGQSPTTASTLKTAMTVLLLLDKRSFAMRPTGAAVKSSNPAKQ